MLIERMRKRLAADRVSFIEPCLPSPADKPPSGANWVHVIKHDGYRLMATRDPIGIRLITPEGQRLDDPLPACGGGREAPHGAVLFDRREVSDGRVSVHQKLRAKFWRLYSPLSLDAYRRADQSPRRAWRRD